MENLNEDDVISEMCDLAKQKAVEAGADPSTVEIIELDNMPLQYVQMRASRIVVRAVRGIHQTHSRSRG